MFSAPAVGFIRGSCIRYNTFTPLFLLISSQALEHREIRARQAVSLTEVNPPRRMTEIVCIASAQKVCNQTNTCVSVVAAEADNTIRDEMTASIKYKGRDLLKGLPG